MMKLPVCGVRSIAALSVVLVAGVSFAQPGGGGPRGGPGGPGGLFGGGGVLGLAQQQEVQQEIELSEDQQAQLQTLSDTIRSEVRDQMQGMFQGLRDLSDEERQAKFAEIRTKFEEINKDAETRLQSVLMPHQLDRLKQIDLQSRIQRGGAAALTEGELADTLGLSEDQRAQIRDKAEQVQKDLQEKIGQLRVDARNQLLEVLTPDQRSKLESMMGAEFALPEPQFGGPGGRGGRGAAFGGRAGRGGRNRGNNNQPSDAPAAQSGGN
jgi:Spy/CpxP family protein refolding chaperone